MCFVFCLFAVDGLVTILDFFLLSLLSVAIILDKLLLYLILAAQHVIAIQQSRLGLELESSVLPFLSSRGVTSVGVMGFCWGGWAMAHACSSSHAGEKKKSSGDDEKSSSGSSPAASTEKRNKKVSATTSSSSRLSPLRVECGVGLHASPIEVYAKVKTKKQSLKRVVTQNCNSCSFRRHRRWCRFACVFV